MALSPVSNEQAEIMVRKTLFDEAVRMGETSVAQSQRWRAVTIKLIDAMEEALDLMKSGRIDKARDRLINAAKAGAAVLR